ncbi:MAG: hypothetical protein FJ255_02145 [Phycisphaerae bacterium]|nr:hypothetical protein [Phycisphaerae bacterium]
MNDVCMLVSACAAGAALAQPVLPARLPAPEANPIRVDYQYGEVPENAHEPSIAVLRRSSDGGYTVFVACRDYQPSQFRHAGAGAPSIWAGRLYQDSPPFFYNGLRPPLGSWPTLPRDTRSRPSINPRLAVDLPSGDFHVTALGYGDWTASSVYHLRWSAASSGWQPATLITNTAFGDKNGWGAGPFDDFPRVTAWRDGSGARHLVAGFQAIDVDTEGGVISYADPRTLVHRSGDLGENWDPPLPPPGQPRTENVSATGAWPSRYVRGSVPLVTSWGRVVSVYAEASNGVPGRVGAIKVAWSNPSQQGMLGGAPGTWSAPVEVWSAADGPRFWHDVPGSRIPAGSSPGFTVAFFHDAVVEPGTGSIYVAYCDLMRAHDRAQWPGPAQAEGDRNIVVRVAKGVVGAGGAYEFPSVSEHVTMPLPPLATFDQFHPAICLDAWGGVNVLWYQTHNSDANMPQPSIADMRVLYTRISNFDWPALRSFNGTANPAEQTATLAGPFDPNITPLHDVGDFISIAAAADRVYAAYMKVYDAGAPPDARWRQGVYAHPILLVEP